MPCNRRKLQKALSGGVFCAILMVAVPATAQPESVNAFLQRIRGAFRTAKSPEDVDSVKAYCRANIASLSFKERDRLGVQAVKLLEAGRIDEANILFRRINSLEELDANLSAMACKP